MHLQLHLFEILATITDSFYGFPLSKATKFSTLTIQELVMAAATASATLFSPFLPSPGSAFPTFHSKSSLFLYFYA